MAEPTINNVAVTGTGTSVAIAANLAAPAAGNFRTLAVFIPEKVGNTPVSIPALPAGFQFIWQSPAARGEIRVWLFGQFWTGASPAATITFDQSVPYTVHVTRTAGGNPNTPIVATPTVVNGKGTSLKSLRIAGQEDAQRVDFWVARYTTGANNTAVITGPPAGTTNSGVTRPGTAAGYIGLSSYEKLTSHGFSPERTATMTTCLASAVLTLLFGGWKELTRNSQTTLAVSSSSTATRAATVATTTQVGLVSDAAGLHAAQVATQTAMDLQDTPKHVNLTRTQLDVHYEVDGSRHTIAETVTVLDVHHEVEGLHIADPANSVTELRLQSTMSAHLTGGGAYTVTDGFTQQYQPTDRPFRVIFQDILSGRFVHWEVPLAEIEVGYALTGPTLIRGRIGPEDDDAVRGIDAWATWVHVEEDGQIRASGIMQPFGIEGDDLVIEAMGVTGYGYGQAYDSYLRAIEQDPAEIIRELFTYLQSYADSRLGITVSDTSTPRLLGDPPKVSLNLSEAGTVQYVKLPQAGVDDISSVDVTAATTKPIVLPRESDGAPFVRVNEGDIPPKMFIALYDMGYQLYESTINGKLALVPSLYDYCITVTGLTAKYLDTTMSKTITVGTGTTATTQTVEVPVREYYIPDWSLIDAKPYELAWYNEVDTGREIENLAKQTPLDYMEVPRWSEDMLSVDQHIQMGYPRLGTRRDDLRFAEGENILDAVLLRESPGLWASEVFVRGAGEGSKAIRARAGNPDKYRVRRTAAITDKTITDEDRGQAVANDEKRRRSMPFTISEIIVAAEHDNAPLGSYALGDDILVHARVPYFGDVALWHRIVGFIWRPGTDDVAISLRRSEQFAYGRLVPDAG